MGFKSNKRKLLWRLVNQLFTHTCCSHGNPKDSIYYPRGQLSRSEMINLIERIIGGDETEKGADFK